MSITIKSRSGATLYVAESAADVRGALMQAVRSGADLSRAYLYGNRLAANTRINTAQDMLTMHPVGSENVTVVLYRTATGHGLNVGCWSGTVDTLAAEVERRAVHWECDEDTATRWRDEYAALETLCRARITAWKGGAE